ncbi:hypothetical protein GLOTRDRAFT_50054, partial [Gloeophyllum trabeum ATCC 11539]
QGGGARYPYPKEVWSPAGGWWTRPSNWKANTAICFAGILAVTYGVWQVSADREVRAVSSRLRCARGLRRRTFEAPIRRAYQADTFNAGEFTS